MRLFLFSCVLLVGCSRTIQSASYISPVQIEKIKVSLSQQELTGYADKEDCEKEILRAVEELKLSKPTYHWIGMPESFEAQQYFFKQMDARFGVKVIGEGCKTGFGIECHNLIIVAAIKVRFGDSAIKDLEDECKEMIARSKKKV